MLDSSQSRSVKKKQILDDSKNDGSIQSNMASTGLSESVSPQSRSRIDSRGYAQTIPNEKLRGQLRAMATDAVASWKTNGIPSSLRLTDGIKRLAEQLVVRTSADSSHVGWTMVTVVSEFWRDQLSKTAPGKKLLLLPDCSGDYMFKIENPCQSFSKCRQERVLIHVLAVQDVWLRSSKLPPLKVVGELLLRPRPSRS